MRHRYCIPGNTERHLFWLMTSFRKKARRQEEEKKKTAVLRAGVDQQLKQIFNFFCQKPKERTETYKFVYTFHMCTHMETAPDPSTLIEYELGQREEQLYLFVREAIVDGCESYR